MSREYDYDDQNIFAKILRGEIPNKTVAESAHTLAFADINPVAPVHVLAIPKGPYVNADHFGAEASEAGDRGFLAHSLAHLPAKPAWRGRRGARGSG